MDDDQILAWAQAHPWRCAALIALWIPGWYGVASLLWFVLTLR